MPQSGPPNTTFLHPNLQGRNLFQLNCRSVGVIPTVAGFQAEGGMSGALLVCEKLRARWLTPIQKDVKLVQDERPRSCQPDTKFRSNCLAKSRPILGPPRPLLDLPASGTCVQEILACHPSGIWLRMPRANFPASAAGRRATEHDSRHRGQHCHWRSCRSRLGYDSWQQLCRAHRW